MNISYNIEKLKGIIDDLCTLTGLAMAVVDSSNRFIYINKEHNDAYCALVQSTPVGGAKCNICDADLLKRTQECKTHCTHLCHAGLWDTTVPIFKGEILVGYIMIGRVRRTSELGEQILESLSSYGIERERARDAYLSMHELEPERLDALVRLISHILIENAIEIDYGSLIHRATEYIERNLSEDLSLTRLCAELFASKNQLYSGFQSIYGTTVNGYVTAERIKRAGELLIKTDVGVQEIAASVGYDNYSYFSRLFKEKKGLSPIAFRSFARKKKAAESEGK